MSEREIPKSSPLEDRALKEAARLFGEELLPLLGIKERVKRVAPTEQKPYKELSYDIFIL